MSSAPYSPSYMARRSSSEIDITIPQCVKHLQSRPCVHTFVKKKFNYIPYDRAHTRPRLSHRVRPRGKGIVELPYCCRPEHLIVAACSLFAPSSSSHCHCPCPSQPSTPAPSHVEGQRTMLDTEGGSACDATHNSANPLLLLSRAAC